MAALLEGEPAHDQVVFATRLQRYWPDLIAGLTGAYPDHAPEMAERLVEIAASNFRAAVRPTCGCSICAGTPTRTGSSTSRCSATPPTPTCSAATCAGVADRVDYLAELGVTYLHLMPLLKPRPGQSDGGYAVMDYRAVREDLGTIDDLRDLATTLRARGISLTLDLVLNHVAAEHQWAVNARAGRPASTATTSTCSPTASCRTRTSDAARGLPRLRPGQLHLRRGVAVLGLDDVQHLAVGPQLAQPGGLLRVRRPDPAGWPTSAWSACGWTRSPSSSSGWAPTARTSPRCTRSPRRCGRWPGSRAPALIFKAEAIVGPADLAPYLGVGKHAGKVSDLAYQNSLMVQIWSALAAKDTRLFCAALNRFPAKPPTTVWGTYLRCHDDIGWAIDDADAASVGLNGFEHRRFLADFYAGLYPMSDARGLVFQENLATGDRRISGTAASLIGIESALTSGDEAHLDLAIRRLLLAYHLVLGFGGLPLLYMGDELALRNDYDFADDRRARRRQPLGAPAARCPGTSPSAGTSRARSSTGSGTGCGTPSPSAPRCPAWTRRWRREILDPVNPAVLVFAPPIPEPDPGRGLQRDRRTARRCRAG